MSAEFSVYQFFMDGSYERVREFVDEETAVKAAHFYTHNVSARMGLTTRVIITDGGDCCCFEWKYGEGVTFPPVSDSPITRPVDKLDSNSKE